MGRNGWNWCLSELNSHVGSNTEKEAAKDSINNYKGTFILN